MSEKLSPCSHCKSTKVSVVKKKGIAGRVTRTPFYRETIICGKCNIEVVARTPGNGVAMWNRSFAGIPPLPKDTEGTGK